MFSFSGGYAPSPPPTHCPLPTRSGQSAVTEYRTTPHHNVQVTFPVTLQTTLCPRA